MTSDEIEALRVRAMARGPLTKHEVNVLLRACLMAAEGCMLVCCDYSQVEARGLAWAAGDHEAMRAFQGGGDPYAKLACRLFGIAAEVFSKETHKQPRDTSKKAELGCGYGMGAPKFKVTAEKGGMVWKAPTCAGGPCTDPLCGFEEADYQGRVFTHGARTIVNTWREVHAPIVGFWQALQDAAITAAHGGRAHVGPYSFGKVGGDVWCMLPSGRPIVYPRMKVGRDAKGRPRLHYWGTEGHPEDLYGGKLAENVTQALCRDLLAAALVKVEAAGLPVVLHVHDEIVIEVPCIQAEAALHQLSAIMQDLPPWAAGFPVAADGFVCRRYMKG